MDELACLRDWDLEAIVRGSCSGTNMDDPNPEFSYFLTEQDELLDSFPEFSETTRVLDDLEELYKPFYPLLHPLSPQTIVTTSSLPIIPIQPQPSSSQGFKVPAAPKSKKSKKKHNKSVVKEVTTAEGVDDAWAWRKYGQKPIKGSAYPRSYYRCSSSKGCLARKQVERSQLDPSVFVVTYSAEHSHPKPTRRNSLAGTTRKNNSLLPPPSTTHQMQLQTIQVQQSFDFKKDQDFIEWLDDDTAQFRDGWIPSSDLENIIGLECQHFPLDAGFHTLN